MNTVFSTNSIFWARICAVVALGVGLLALVPTADEATAAGSGGVALPRADSDAGDAGDKYAAIWERIDRSDKRWARATAECESGGDPDAIGGGGAYRGAFQFMKSTWKAAPKSPGGDPIKHPYRTQAVVAVALKHRDGPSHWPHCG